MKKILLGIFSVMLTYYSFGQSFEGKLTYKVDFEIKPKKIGEFKITKEQVIEKMKKDGEYFDKIEVLLKDGNYIKEDNSKLEKRIIYKSDMNKIYTFQKDFEYVVITDATKYNLMNLDFKYPKIEKMDSLKIIDGYKCKLLKLSWDKLGEEHYFYNSEIVSLDSKLFENHKYEYLNSIVNITKAYPLEIVKTISDFVSIKMTLTSISEEKVDDTLFELPKFKKAKKDYAEMMFKMTGSEVMKLKN